MENKLISMTSFVLNEQRFKEDDAVCNLRITNYANFISQPLKIEMFIPCDANGNYTEDISTEGYLATAMYNDCKSKIIFDGFKLLFKDQYYYTLGCQQTKLYFDINRKEIFTNSIKRLTIEDMVYALIEPLTLTPNALKHIYG